MKKTIKTVVPEKTIDENIYYCDICGTDLDKQNTDVWDYDEGEMYYVEGPIYPEGDGRDFHRIDVCMKCMKNKVIPMIKKEFGITAREHDSPYQSHLPHIRNVGHDR